MNALNHDWIERQERNEDARRDYERERLAAWTMDALAEQMASSRLTKADISRKLGCSRAHVTQVLSGSRNPTLATISDFAWACGMRAAVRFEPLRNGDFISQPVVQVSTTKNIVQVSFGAGANIRALRRAGAQA